MAGRAGLSPNAVSALERGQRKRPYPHTVRALADVLELSEEERAALLEAVPARGEPTSPGAEGATSSPSRLPSPVTLIVGREREVEQVAALVSDPVVRLLTLTGIGGVGKTRLGTEAAREVEASFPDGVAFVGLASLSDPDLFVPTVLRSLGQGEAEGRSPGEALIEHLREKRLLLVLDNFEQLLEAATEVAALIEECPSLTVLVTSRAPLRVRGEREYAVGPLALPASTRSAAAAGVADSSSGKLFLERARAVSSSFEITAENAAAVATICWRLGGLPLALELAAAKVRFLDPAALLPRLDQALSTAWARDLPERQRTMRATLDWSYDLLDIPVQRLFRRLSVFVGGFSLEAAEAVDEDGISGETLVEQSLVFVDAGDGEIRYGMLEPVRQYASAKLGESEESGASARHHAEHFLQFAERVAPELWGYEQAAWFDRLEREGGNLRAAISWSLDAGEHEIAARFCWALWIFWWARGYHQEGRAWTEEALGGRISPAMRSRVLSVAASMAYAQGDYEPAGAYWQEALRISVDEEDALAEGYARAGTGLFEMSRSDFEAAERCFQEALPIFQEHGEEFMGSLVCTWTGTTFLARGEPETARRTLEEGLESARRRGNSLGTYVALYNLAQLALVGGDLALAADALRQGVELSEWTRDLANLAHFMEALATVAALRGEAKRAALLLGAADGALLGVGAPVYNFYVTDPALRERTVADARSALGEAIFEEIRARGESMTFDDAVRYALGDGPA